MRKMFNWPNRYLCEPISHYNQHLQCILVPHRRRNIPEVFVPEVESRIVRHCFDRISMLRKRSSFRLVGHSDLTPLPGG
jgi:hypothetical protein